MPTRLDRAAPQHGLDARQQHVRVEGLGDVVVGAQLQPQNGIQLTAASRDEDHRRVGLLLEQPQRVQAVHAGQAHVQQDQVRPIALGEGQGILGAAGRTGPVAGLLQLQTQAAPHQRVVVNY